MSSIGALARRSRWKWTTLDEVAAVITGNTPPTNDIENYGDAIPFVKPTELVDKPIHSAPQALSAIGARIARTAPAGAVLVSCIGLLGKTGIARTPVAFNQQINAIVFNELVLPEFGFYYVQTLRPWLYGQASATTLPIVNKGKFLKAPFPLAPPSEQRRTVNEIEKQLSRLDEGVANLNRVKTNLNRYKAAVLLKAIERLETRPLGTLLREPLRNGHSAKATSDPNGLRAFTLTAVTDGDFSEVNTKRTVAEARKVRDLWAEPGDIFIERSNTPELVGTARLYRGPANFAFIPDLLIRVRLTDAVLPEFAEIALQSEHARRYFRSRAQGIAGSMPKIDQGTVEAFPLPLPDLEEQRRITREVSRRLSIIHGVGAAIDAERQRVAALRHAILETCLSGKELP